MGEIIPAGFALLLLSRIPWIFSLSLLLNALGLISIARVIQGRGGIQYIRAVLLKDNEATIDAGSRARREMFAALPPSLVRPVVFLGDSLTAGFEWGEAFPGIRPVLNRGIGGDTSLGVLERLVHVCGLNPISVLVMVGTNDPQMLGYAPIDTLENVRTIIRRILESSPDVSIYIQSVLPSRSPKFNRWSAQLNDHLSKLEDGKQIKFINLRPLFLDHGNALNWDLTYDSLHLNAKGYLTWQQAVRPLVEKFVSSERGMRAPG